MLSACRLLALTAPFEISDLDNPQRSDPDLPVGLVTGSQPFAGLPTNPAELALSHLDGLNIGGVRIVTVSTPVSHAELPRLLPALIERHQPAFVMALGLALGAPTVRVETLGVNACHFRVPDNFGVRPVGGQPIEPAGPAARAATWNGKAIVEAILKEGIPAGLSFHAGTHLCNFTLYTYLGALEARGLKAPCGFLHLPLLPEQLVWMLRQPAAVAANAFGPNLDLPTMELATELRAIKAALGALAAEVSAPAPAKQAI